MSRPLSVDVGGSGAGRALARKLSGKGQHLLGAALASGSGVHGLRKHSDGEPLSARAVEILRTAIDGPDAEVGSPHEPMSATLPGRFGTKGTKGKGIRRGSGSSAPAYP